MLRAHHDVRMHGEIFHIVDLRDPEDGYDGQPPPEDVFEARRREPQRMLRHVQCHTEGRRVVGFKIFRDHARPINWPKLTAWCDVCIILQRADVEAQYRSLMYARRTGKWKGRTNRRAFANLTLDDGFNAWSHNQRSWYAYLETQLSRRGTNASVVRLTFERDLARSGDRRRPDVAPIWRALRLPSPL